MIADGALIADRYRVLGKLGQGGMGQVYLAEHVRMGRKSALKIMNPGISHDPDAVNRFSREAANASRINHTNVASVYDFGETADGLLFLAMEYVDGEPLSTIIAREGALPLKRAASIARQVAAALRVAHHLGIVHRDVKPDNIMIARDIEGEELVKVVDFGIAKVVWSEGQKLTRTGLSIGTPEYMSPEQLASENVDARSDIYSLGLVTFAMLTGELPFPMVTTRETLVARLVDKPATLISVRGDVAWPSGLQAVMDKVLAPKAADRYQEASDFCTELLAAIDSAPTSAAVAAAAATQLAPRVPVTRRSAPARLAPATPPPSQTVSFLSSSGGRTILWGSVVGAALVVGAVAVIVQNQRHLQRPSRTVVATAPRRTPQPPAATAPLPPGVRVPTLRDSTRAAADDVAVLRRAAAAGDRVAFQSAYRQAAVLIARLAATHPRDPEVRATRDWMIGVRDSLRTRCRQDASICENLGLTVPATRFRRQRAP